MLRSSSLAITVLSLSVSMSMSMSAFAATSFDIDQGHSAVLFSTTHFGAGLTHGRFNDVAGSFSIDEKRPAASQIKITIKTASVDSHDKKRDEHLRGPDFFNAKQFPTMTFVSKKMKRVGKGKLTVTGDLTLHGVTRSVTVQLRKIGEGKDPWGGYRQGWTTDFAIKRSEYGMKFMLDGVGDVVNLTVSIEGVRKKK